MWRTLGITETDWQQTPPAVQTKLRSQYHEAHSLKLRSVSAKKQIAALSDPAARIQQLNRRIASQRKQITHLQQQLIQQYLTDTARWSTEIARLKAEIAHLKENFGQNSRIRVCRRSLIRRSANRQRHANHQAAGKERRWDTPEPDTGSNQLNRLIA